MGLVRERNYAKDYIRQEGGGKKPKYIYQGTWYVVDLSDEEYKKLKFSYGISGIVLFAMLILAGLVNTGGSRTIYVVFPYIITVFPLIYTEIGICNLVFGERRMTQKAYDYSLMRVRKSAAAIAVLAVCSAVGELAYLILESSGGNPAGEMIYLMAVTLMAAAAYLLGRRKVPVRTEASGQDS